MDLIGYFAIGVAGEPLVTQPESVWEVPVLSHTCPSALLGGMYGEKMPTEKKCMDSLGRKAPWQDRKDSRREGLAEERRNGV